MKKIYLFLFILANLGLQSCFDIVEQISVKKDGSGEIQLTLNFSKSKTRVASVLKMKTINGRPVPTTQEINNKVKDIENTLRNSKGISDVSSKLDWNNYIATIKCQFKHIEDLNNAIASIGQTENAPKAAERNYTYHTAGKIFERLSNFSLKKDYQALSNADKEVFNNAKFTGIYRFTDKIISATHPAGKISADGTAVMMQLNVLDIVTDKVNVQNKITLSK